MSDVSELLVAYDAQLRDHVPDRLPRGGKFENDGRGAGRRLGRRCPQAAAVDVQTNVTSVVAAAFRLIPKVYAARPPGSNLVAQHPLIVEALRLEPQRPPLPGVASWWRLAAHRCGATVATASWLVAAMFPNRKIATPSTGIIFLVHQQRGGWQVWWRYR